MVPTMVSVTASRSAARRLTPQPITRTVRVTHVVFDFNGGGLESLIAEMAARFRGSAVDVSLLTLSGRVGRLGEHTRHRFDQFDVIRPWPVVSLAYPRGTTRAIQQTRPDVVHLHSGAWYKPALAARLAGTARVIYTEHGREHYDPAVQRFIDRCAAKLTDSVVAVSGRLSRYLAQRVGVSAGKICTIHNGVDTAVFTPGPAPSSLRASLELADDAIVIGSIGRLEAVKSYETLLEAAAVLRREWKQPFAIVLYGDGSERESLEACVDRLGVRDLVRFVGWTDRPLDAHRLIDLFVLPSRSEGQSVSLMEAMSCGCVPIVTDVGANAEMLGPGMESHVVQPGRPAEMARAIRLVADQKLTLRAIGESMRRRAIEQYSLDRMIEQYERLYRGRALDHSTT